MYPTRIPNNFPSHIPNELELHFRIERLTEWVEANVNHLKREVYRLSQENAELKAKISKIESK